ncbi:hypothetical protein L484_014205 [Morus notabilis]|uniref:Uncharacterized protein n=1 Tax=Morus notabilis TaxID=981085 RepID=W9S2V7_9ROSA|nr:hypothetical protein L484_014205 [Morus notabilis]
MVMKSEPFITVMKSDPFITAKSPRLRFGLTNQVVRYITETEERARVSGERECAMPTWKISTVSPLLQHSR